MPSATPASDELELRVVALELEALPEISVVIRRNPRARHVRLHVDEAGTVSASIPRRFALRRLDAIVRDRGPWLVDVLTKMDLAARATEVDLRRGDPVRLLGRWVSTQVVPGRYARGHVDDVSGILELSVPTGADPYDVLARWYRDEARRVVGERVAHWCAEFGLRHGNIAIRDQRTRWGSCNHRGDLSFNWRLVLAPLWVLDAIVVHELCHIEELNHSHRFWALVHARYPQHDAANDWLRAHGAALRITRPRFGPALRDAADRHIAPPRADDSPRARTQTKGRRNPQLLRGAGRAEQGTLF